MAICVVEPSAKIHVKSIDQAYLEMETLWHGISDMFG